MSKSKTKKLLAVLLLAAMVLGMLPFSSFAASTAKRIVHRWIDTFASAGDFPILCAITHTISTNLPRSTLLSPIIRAIDIRIHT